jgi:putative ABC transport system substrate-binding protein
VGVLAAKQATTTIPIVMESLATDPVATGLVESLARPGGNITGFTIMTIEMAGKRLELFKAAVPTLSRVAVLYHAFRTLFSGSMGGFQSALLRPT